MPDPRPHTTVVVANLPPCDFDPDHGPAYADAKTKMGPWGFVCKDCFDQRCIGLGLGLGQRLILEGSDEHRAKTT